MEENKVKTALVLEGGAMRGIYTAGVLDVLMDNKIKVDAIICADLGVISMARRLVPNLAVHVSTQANITNSESAKVFIDMGVRRLILAREMTLEEIKSLRDKIPETIELEALCHGAMCISYSGRCLLSNFFTGRDANR